MSCRFRHVIYIRLSPSVQIPPVDAVPAEPGALFDGTAAATAVAAAISGVPRYSFAGAAIAAVLAGAPGSTFTVGAIPAESTGTFVVTVLARVSNTFATVATVATAVLAGVSCTSAAAAATAAILATAILATGACRPGVLPTPDGLQRRQRQRPPVPRSARQTLLALYR